SRVIPVLRIGRETDPSSGIPNSQRAPPFFSGRLRPRGVRCLLPFFRLDMHVTERRRNTPIRRPPGATNQSRCLDAGHILLPSFFCRPRGFGGCRYFVSLHSSTRPAALLSTRQDARCTRMRIYRITHKDAIILVAVSRGFTNSNKATTLTNARLLHIHSATQENANPQDNNTNNTRRTVATHASRCAHKHKQKQGCTGYTPQSCHRHLPCKTSTTMGRASSTHPPCCPSFCERRHRRRRKEIAKPWRP
ncbi:unnamed protein product, partial [Ectocarpus sp. 12 AP-2014]